MTLYLWLKVLHILGAVIFLGNITITGWWKLMADRTGHPPTIAFAQRQVTLTDFIFTSGGAVLVFITGWGQTLLGDLDIFHTPWLLWGLGLFALSGLIWAGILIPIQIRQARMARAFADDGQIPENYWQLSKQWLIWGTLATLLPLANLYWMVFKPV